MSHIYLLMGLPFTGKSTYARQTSLPLIEIDEVRKTLTGSYQAQDQTSSLIFDVVFQSASHYLSNDQDVIIEGLFLTEKSRKVFIDLANTYNASIDVLWFDPSLEWIKQNMLKNEKIEKKHVTLAYLEGLLRDVDFPTTDEGIHRIFYYTEKDFVKN